MIEVFERNLFMLVRIITSIVGVAVLIPIMWFSDTYVFPAVLAIFGIIALYEVFSCIKLKGKPFITVPAYLLGAAIPFACKYFGEFDKVASSVCAGIFLYIAYLVVCSVVFHKSCDVNTLSMCFLFAIYIIGGFSSIQLLRNLNDGILAVMAVILAAWVTDIFAYFTGKFLGKHKLCEEISPKKTVEGSIGGTLGCIVVFVAYSFIVLPKGASVGAHLFIVAIGFVMSVVSQFGDLAMSVIKRKYGVKDFGNIFPGHGGILDRFDSILAVSPIFLIIILLTKNIVM